MRDLKLYRSIANCGIISIHIEIRRFKNGGSGEVGDLLASSTWNMRINRYVHTNMTSADKEDVWSNADLFIRDNQYDDIGDEPFWTDNLTSGGSIFNTNWKDGTLKENILWQNAPAEHSAFGRSNHMHVKVENRGCVTSQAGAQLDMYWTIARVWEPWGKTWYNFTREPVAAGNKVMYNGKEYPAGNPITLEDENDYASNIKSLSLPPISFFYEELPNNGNTHGGCLALNNWKAPDPVWYNPPALPGIFMHSPVEPVLCYLAVLREPWKKDEGLHTPVPYNNPGDYRVTDFAKYNNNVATVNSYLATNNDGYKVLIPGTNTYLSHAAYVHINSPTKNLSLISNDPVDFLRNGDIYLGFDEALWNRWTNGNAIGQGSGFEFVEPRVLRVTNAGMLTLQGISQDGTEMGKLAVMFAYDGNRAPEGDYQCSYSLGAYEEDPRAQVGSPTWFVTDVLKVPAAETPGESFKTVPGGQQQPLLHEIQLYPNPAGEEVTISMQADVTGQVQISVCDIAGRVAMESCENIRQIGMQAFRLNTARLPTGQYVVNMKLGNTTYTARLLK